MRNQAVLNLKDSYLQKFFERTNIEKVEKAIIIENNNVHAYGYQDYELK